MTQGRSAWLVYDLTSEVTERHFCQTLLVGIVLMIFQGLRARDITHIIWWEVNRRSTLSSVGKESDCNAGDLGLIPGSGRYSGEENGNPLQYSCLENPMVRGAWWAIVYGLQELDTTGRLSTREVRPVPLQSLLSGSLPSSTEPFCFSNMPRILLPHAVNIFLQNTFLHMGVFLLGKSHGRRSLVGCSPWGR